MQETKNKIVKALRWSEKYTKTDMVYLAKGGSWLGISQIISSVAVFSTSIAFANLLSPDVYGIYKYVLSIASILSITTLTGMDSAIMQSVARGYEGSLGLALKTKLKWGTLGTLVSLLISLYYYTQGNIYLALSFCIVAVFMPIYESFDIYNSFLFGKKLFDKQTIFSIITKIVIVYSILTTLFLTKNLIIILSVYFLSLTIPGLFFFYKTIKKYKQNNDKDSGLVGYGKHLSFINIISLVMAELDKILIFQHIGAANLAIYTIAVAPTDQIKGLLKNINSLAFPKFAKQEGEDIRKNINHKIKILSITTGIIVAIYIILSPIFFRVFFPKYLDSIIYSQILAISIVGAVISAFLYTVLESQKAKIGLYKINLYTSIFSVVILFPLVFYFGVMGAVVSRLVSRIFSSTFSYFLVQKID